MATRKLTLQPLNKDVADRLVFVHNTTTKLIVVKSVADQEPNVFDINREAGMFAFKAYVSQLPLNDYLVEKKGDSLPRVMTASLNLIEIKAAFMKLLDLKIEAKVVKEKLHASYKETDIAPVW